MNNFAKSFMATIGILAITILLLVIFARIHTPNGVLDLSNIKGVALIVPFTILLCCILVLFNTYYNYRDEVYNRMGEQVNANKVIEDIKYAHEQTKSVLSAQLTYNKKLEAQNNDWEELCKSQQEVLREAGQTCKNHFKIIIDASQIIKDAIEDYELPIELVNLDDKLNKYILDSLEVPELEDDDNTEDKTQL